MPLTADADIAALLRATRRIAVIGASAKPDRPSFGVMKALLDHGYDVVPVNPGLAGQQIHAQTVVATLADVVPPADMVDVFRDSSAVAGIVDEAITHGAASLWLQLGVIDAIAASKAEAAGLVVVMDHCPKIELRRLGVSGPA
jgi:uncharacterized protein